MINEKYIVNTVKVGRLAANCYLISDKVTKLTVIIDPGAENEKIILRIEQGNYIPVGIINTHGHADHILANSAIKKKYCIPTYIHKDDARFLVDSSLNGSLFLGEPFITDPADFLVEDGEVIKLGTIELKVFHTPGHTPGGICLVAENNIFTGDTLFCGSIGRCDLLGGNEKLLMKSLKIFSQFPLDYFIFPGHENSCNIGSEYKHNIFLNR